MILQLFFILFSTDLIFYYIKMVKKLDKEKATKGDFKAKDGDFITRLYISGEAPINIYLYFLLF